MAQFGGLLVGGAGVAACGSVHTGAGAGPDTATAAATATADGTAGRQRPGTLLWRFRIDQPLCVVSSGDKVFVGADTSTPGSGGTYAMDAGTGKRIWRSSPTCYAANSGMVFGLEPFSITAMNAATGRVLWKGSSGTPNTGSASTWIACTGHTVCLPTQIDNSPSADEVVLALDARTGKRIWLARFAMVTALLAVDGVVYAGSLGAKPHVATLDAATGKRLWDSAVNTPPGALAMTDGVVAGGSDDSLLSARKPVTFALDAATGDRLWQLDIDSGAALAAGDGLVFASSGGLTALAARTGRPVWKHPIGVTAPTALAVANGVVYAGIANHEIQALAATTGRKLWTYRAKGPVLALVTANDAVYAVTVGVDAYAYALQA